MINSSQESKQFKMDIGESTTIKSSTGTPSHRTSICITPDTEEHKNLEKINSTSGNCEYPESTEKISWCETCRVCANKTDHIIPIFEGEGAEHDLSNKIHKHLPIRVSRDDTLPLQLCYHCAATILAWHELLEGCVDAEKRLMRMESELGDKEQMRLKYVDIRSTNCHLEEVIAVSEELVDDPEPIAAHGEEEICMSEKVEELSEVVECTANPEGEERLSDSKICSKPTSGFTDFQRAYVDLFGCAKNERTTKTESEVSVDPRDDKTETRESSKEISTALISFNKERKENTTATVRPNRRNKKSVRVTIAAKASSKRSVSEKCEKLIVTELTESRLRSNVKMMKNDAETKLSKSRIKRTSNGPYNCDLCGKKFRLRDSLKTHTRIHTGEKQFTCHICGKQFAQTGCLYYHLKHVHAGVKNHSCDICGRSFAMKTTMEDHRRSIHTGERPFVCDSCGKTFKTKSSLYIHSRIHTEMYPHECKYCKKVFRWRQQLLGHLTIHTGEKNHSCDVCGKAFGVKNHLTRHKRTHSIEKPYACDECGMSFGQKRYLTTHERLKHG